MRRGRDPVKSLKAFKKKFGDAAGDLIALHEATSGRRTACSSFPTSWPQPSDPPKKTRGQKHFRPRA